MSENDKPVVVRVKRKANQSPLEAIWLEINERPLKRPLLDFEKLSISNSSTKAVVEEPKAKKVLVHHVETIINSDLTVDFLQSFMPYSSSEASQPNLKKLGERQNIKADKKQEKLLTKARNDQEVLSKSARFEQIWRSRKGNRGETNSEVVHEICHLYDIVRIDVEENGNGKEEEEEEDPNLEEYKIMASYLPLLREFVPDGAKEVESNIQDYMSKKASKDDYVYDFYAVKDDDINRTLDDESFPFPLVKVDEDDEFYDGPDDPDYDSYDSNAEDNPAYDYPDEEDSDEDIDNESSKGDDKSEVSNDKSDDGDEQDFEDMEPRKVVAPHVKDADIIYYENDEGLDDYY